MATEAPAAAPAAPSASVFASRPGAVAVPFEGLEDMEKMMGAPAAAATEAAATETAEPAATSEETAAPTAEDTPLPEETLSTEEMLNRMQSEQETAASDKDKEVAAETEKVAAEKAEADKKAAEAAEAAKTTATSATPERDKDLELAEAQKTHLHPKTKTLIEARNKAVREARDARDAVAKEKAELEAQLKEAREAAAKTVVPKQVEEELKTLRERVRELDITRDPALQSKYDTPIEQNTNKALDLLKSFGVGKTVDGKDDPAAIQALQKAGLSFKTLKPYIDKLDEIGEVDAAEALRESVRENIRLARGKEQEISAWKADYEGRVAQRNTTQQQQQEEFASRVRTTAKTILDTDMASIAKSLPYVLPPPAPEAKDAPAVAAAKQKALDEFNTTKTAVDAAIKSWDATGLPPEKAAEAHGRLTASAVKGQVFTQIVLPRILKDQQALTAKVTQLTAELAKFKNASATSRAHAQAAAAPAKGGEIPANLSTGDAMATFAKSLGIS